MVLFGYLYDFLILSGNLLKEINLYYFYTYKVEFCLNSIQEMSKIDFLSIDCSPRPYFGGFWLDITVR